MVYVVGCWIYLAGLDVTASDFFFFQISEEHCVTPAEEGREAWASCLEKVGHQETNLSRRTKGKNVLNVSIDCSDHLVLVFCLLVQK